MDQATPYDFAAAGCSREAFDVKFSYFSAEEIKRVSAHQISSVDAFTDLGEIMESGLYSDRLGPLDMKKFTHKDCPTCGLTKDCPGHLGHIELVCPVYNPLLFMDLFKLLRRTCLSCGHLKTKTEKTERIVRALSGLLPHQLPESAVDELPLPFDKKLLTSDTKAEERCLLLEENASTGKSKKVWLENGEEQQARTDEIWKKVLERDIEEDPTPSKAKEGQDLVFKETSALESFRGILQEYVSNIPAGACANCGAKAAKWRRDGYTKLFVKKTAEDEDMFCLPIYVRKVLKDLWENEGDILRWMIPGSVEHGSDIFFLDCLLVPPNRFRNPIPARGGNLQLHAHTAKLKEILIFNERMRLALRGDSKVTKDEKALKRTMKNAEDAPIQSPVLEFQGLQEAVNCFIDSTKSSQNQKLVTPGVRQLLEKKEGMFRMKMMGKRVNFAARSVISPDPNIETTEIGIPKLIADDLTYAEVANSTNAKWLSEIIIRGDRYPGAKEVHVPQANGSKRVFKLKTAPQNDREALAKQLVTDLDNGAPPMTVMRHIRDGDPLLVNRQPTLHKPGIMAHLAKVMQNDERTIRLHYANCSTYNADFDGDEMNLHAPQDPLGRIEALSIARAEKQYLVPTSGKPLRGLIQDHVIGGVMLTRRDSYLTKNEVCNLIYIGIRAALEGGDLSSDKAREIEKLKMRLQRHPQKLRVHLDEPTLLKPRKLWTGKQVLSMLVKNIFILCGKKDKKDAEGMNFSGKSKTSGDIWNGILDGNKEEGTVIFQGTELLMGVLDKNQFGSTSFGIIHLVHEILGAKAVGMVLAGFARLFSAYLQMRGFTCAYADLILTEPTEDNRKKLVANSRRVAQETIRDWLNKFDVAVPNAERTTSQELSRAGRGLIEANRSSADTLEASMLGRMRQSWTNTIDACVPSGMVLPVPKNCMASMVQTGAKGSKVNQSMISCLLGQQELEGRQPPLMPTRRSLPSFSAYDLSSRTRGFITDRFLTGIRPQEFFFHCMAGREGLVDTAVKTSRSGYLQRCLVKHLESLKVCYDMTVRDGDGTVVQFLYGDDGVDVTLSSHLFKFDALFDNFKNMQAESKEQVGQLKSLSKDAGAKKKVTEFEAAPAFHEAVKAARDGHLSSSSKKLSALEARAGELQLDDVAIQSLRGATARLKDAKKGVKEGAQKGSVDQLFDPIASVLTPAHFFGSTSDKHESDLQKFLKGLLDQGKCTEKEAQEFAQFMHQKYLKSLAQPGEAVGVIAAQSMGEPSTQMTLNTFHLAGHGGANVTLGIPRLREIVQTASATPSTPLMKVEVLADMEGNTDQLSRRKMANHLAARFRRVTLLDVIRKVGIEEKVRLHKGELIRSYFCRFEFWPIAELELAIPHINRDVITRYMSTTFVRLLKNQVQKMMTRIMQAAPSKQKAKRTTDEGEEAAEGNEGDDDTNPVPKKKRKVMGRGQRDGADMEDEIENEEKADAAEDTKANEDDMSEGSGMYSDVSSEEGEKNEEQDAPDEEGQDKKKDGADDVMDQDDDEKEALPEPQDAKKKKKKKEDVQASETKGVKDPDRQVDIALESGSLVWSSELDKTDSINIVVSFPLSSCPQKLLVSEIVKHLAAEKCVFEDKNALGVKKVHVEEGEATNKGKIYLQCEGVNLAALQLLPKGTVDVARITTNDIHAVLNTYGVEAARANIVKEVRGVFGHYGIEVNHRHLSLIGDFMTRAGGFRPFSRRGMTHCTSPFLAMSYETTMQFCQAACQDRVSDTMSSPSANIVLGNPVKLGTGMVNLLVDLSDAGPKPKKTKRTFDFSTPLTSAPVAPVV